MMKKTLVSLLALCGCAADEGTMIEIVGSGLPSAACVVAPDSSQFTSSGNFDPTGLMPYSMPLVVQNHLRGADADQAVVNSTNVRVESNRVSIVGFDVCYYLGSDEKASEFGSAEKGLPISCDDVPEARREFVFASSTVAPAGGQAALWVDLFGLEAQRGVFGSDWDPEELIEGVQPFDTNGDSDTADQNDFRVVNSVSSPEDTATREAAWGTFPATIVTTVVAQVRAVGRTQTGTPVRSNWFTYPFEVCVGCALSVCGDYFGDATCTAPGAVVGQAFAANACLPFSGHSKPACEAYSTCPD